MRHEGSGPARASAGDLLAIAAWFGLATGLAEGVIRTVLQALGFVSWELRLKATSVEIVWIAACLYVVFFLLAGVALAAVNRMAPRLKTAKAAVFFFGLVSFADLLSSSGRLSQWGVGMLALGLAVVLTRWFNAHEKPAVNFWRRSVGWLVALALLSFFGIKTGLWMQERNAISRLSPAAPGSPNVLVILVDTLRADHLSLYGYNRKTSPNLEKIAAHSVVFENAIAPAPWTLPSHASILTGLYPSEHGAEKTPLDGRSLVLPEALQARGYRTGGFSANLYFFTRAQGFKRGFIRFDEYFRSISDAVARTLLGRHFVKEVLPRAGYVGYAGEGIGRRLAEEINDDALEWLEKDRNRPFFAFLNYIDVHTPLLPPQPFRNAFSKEANPGEQFNKQSESSLLMEKVPARVVEDGIAAYDGAVLYADAQIGRLLEELDRRGLGQNTIVIITSDHGNMFGEHDDFGHEHAMYAPLLYVPLIIRWPGRIPGGQRVETPVSLASLPSTVMSLVSAGEPGPFPGPSLVPLWSEARPPVDWPYPWGELAACPEHNWPQIPCFSGALKAIVSPDWYFICHEKQAPQLYDAKKDRAQMHNLAETPEGQKVVAEFLARVREKRMRMGALENNTLPAKR